MKTTIAFFLLSLASTGCLDSYVGAECADGFTETGGVCVATTADSGVDTGMPDTGMDSSMDAGDAGDSSVDTGDSSMDARDSSTDATDSGGDGGDGGGGCDLGETVCGMDCVRTRTDPMNCGGCGVSCAATEVCSRGACVPACLPPEEICAGRCFDPAVSNDPTNCGTCGNRCVSGICIDGMCADAMAGHVILIGHDYEMALRPQQRIAGNSVFLPSGATVDVLVWEGSATIGQLRGVDRAIDRVARERGRAWTKITTSPDKLLEELEFADVFLLYPQPGAMDAELTSFGASLSRGFATFLRRGGVIIVFDTPSVANAGTWQFLTGAGLMMVTAHADVTGSALTVTALGDAIALGVTINYAAETNTVRFDTTAPEVVVHPAGPVVLHGVTVPAP